MTKFYSPNPYIKNVTLAHFYIKIWCRFAPVTAMVSLRIPTEIGISLHLPLLYFQLQRRGIVEN